MVESRAQTDALDLRLQPREQVRIDGKTFDLMPLGDLSVTEQAKVRRHGERLAAIEEKGEAATPEDDREYEDRLRSLARMALPDAPAGVIKKLGLGQVRALVTAFFVRGAERPEFTMLAGLRSPISSPTLPASTGQASGS